MATRNVTWARVEYQPNLVNPAEPIPLGVIAEETRGRSRYIVILGREPRGDVPGMQLEGTWGPFRGVVAEWAETMSRTMREFVDNLEPGQSAIDELSKRWNLNVYLRQPEAAAVAATVGLDEYAMRWYEQYVGDKFPRLGRRPRAPLTRSQRRRLESWRALNVAQAIA
jgi:hypothetical protein